MKEIRDFPLGRQRFSAGQDLAQIVLTDALYGLQKGETQTLNYTAAAGDEVRMTIKRTCRISKTA